MDAAGHNDVAHRGDALERCDFTLPSTLDSVAVIERATEAIARHAGFDDDTATNVAMVTHEAAVNAVKHGNQFAKEKTITVHLSRTAKAIEIRIADQGEGLDPASLPDPLDPANLLRSSGRGIFLMRAMMDEVNFRQLEQGTEVTLIKYRHTEASS